MQNISAAWIYPIIIVGGLLQAWGPPMNGTLRDAVTNPWLSIISAGSELPCMRSTDGACWARC